VFFLLSYIFSSTKLEKRAEQVLLGSGGDGGGGAGGWGGGERGGTNNVSKCKNDKINGGKSI
jgi:hypothetical protein